MITSSRIAACRCRPICASVRESEPLLAETAAASARTNTRGGYHSRTVGSSQALERYRGRALPLPLPMGGGKTSAIEALHADHFALDDQVGARDRDRLHLGVFGDELELAVLL